MRLKSVLAALVAGLVVAGTVLGQGQGLTPQAIKNGKYFIDIFEARKWAQLQDGAYTLRQGDEFLDVRLTRMALGDLTGKGGGDAAVILATNTGRTGVFMDLAAVVNQGGQPRHVASEPLGDRIKVNGIRIEDGVIILNMVVHRDTDPSCCPTLKTTARYKLQGNKLAKQ